MSEARQQVDAWVAAGLLLQRGEQPSPELIASVRIWLESVTEVLALLPPLGVAADLGRLLTRAPFDIARSLHVEDPGLRTALDAYEEHLLGRLAADFQLEAARDALLRLPESLRPAAIAVFVEQVLGRVSASQPRATDEAHIELLESPAPGAVRRTLQRQSHDHFELGHEVLREPEWAPLRAELSQSYAMLAAGARRCGSLIGDVEIYTLENHEALRSSSLRLAMAQIAEAAQTIERTLPARVRRSDQSRGRTPTRIEDESAYPIGGYASISNVGGIESLVSSELIYMTPDAERRAGEIDLFDVRWAADELLKYTRDESVHTRERRTISFVLAPTLVHGRIKDPELPFQRLVVLFGGLVAGVRKLSAWLDEAELHLHFLLIAKPRKLGDQGEHEQPLRPEAELVRLLLREYLEVGVVEIHELEGEDQAFARVEAATSTGGSDVVWIAQEPQLPHVDEKLEHRTHAIAIGQASPRVWIDGEARELRADGWEAWVESFQRLLAALV